VKHNGLASKRRLDRMRRFRIKTRYSRRTLNATQCDSQSLICRSIQDETLGFMKNPGGGKTLIQVGSRHLRSGAVLPGCGEAIVVSPSEQKLEWTFSVLV